MSTRNNDKNTYLDLFKSDSKTIHKSFENLITLNLNLENQKHCNI